MVSKYLSFLVICVSTVLSNCASEENTRDPSTDPSALTIINSLDEMTKKLLQDKFDFEKQKLELNNYTYEEETKLFYKAFDSRVPWAEAKNVCAQDNTKLAVTYTEMDAQALIKRFPKRVYFIWLGIHDTLATREFTSIDGKTSDELYLYWGLGEPSDNKTFNCVVMDRDAVFKVSNCDTKMFAFICTKRLGEIVLTPTCQSKDYEFDPQSGNCYKLHRVPRVWSEAWNTCKVEQARLMMLNSKREKDYLVDILSQHPISNETEIFNDNILFVDFEDSFGNGTYTTSEGQTLEEAGYEVWAPKQPNALGDSNCGAMNKKGLLGVANCCQKTWFFCEKSSKPNSEKSQLQLDIIMARMGN